MKQAFLVLIKPVSFIIPIFMRIYICSSEILLAQTVELAIGGFLK